MQCTKKKNRSKYTCELYIKNWSYYNKIWIVFAIYQKMILKGTSWDGPRIELHLKITNTYFTPLDDSACKGDANLYTFSWTVVSHITLISLHYRWSKRNVKGRYLHHKVTGDQLCGRAITEINFFSFDFSVSFSFR